MPIQGGTYDNLMRCIWTISANKNEYISLHFQQFDVLTSDKLDCSQDYVEVRDGPDKESQLLGNTKVLNKVINMLLVIFSHKGMLDKIYIENNDYMLKMLLYIFIYFSG